MDKIGYLTRVDWGAKPATVTVGYGVPPTQMQGWVLHHTYWVMPDFDRDGFLHGDHDDIREYMRRLQRARPDLGNEVPYSWVVFRGARDDQCVIAEGRGRGRTGAHTAGLNSSRYAWAIAGDSDQLGVTPGMIRGMRWLAARETPWAREATIGHKDAPAYWSDGRNLNATACPGRVGYTKLPDLQPPFVDPEEDDDMPAVRFLARNPKTNEVALFTEGSAWRVHLMPPDVEAWKFLGVEDRGNADPILFRSTAKAPAGEK